MNVLFLAISAGGGHIKAAEAIKECIESNFINSKTYIVDAYKYVSPIVDKVVVGGYLKTLKNSPKLWGKLYDLAEKGENVNDISKTLNRILSFKIRKLVSDFKPDVIVCTHPFPLQMACNLKKQGKINTPIVTIMTDYASHTFWINKYVDAYVVANESIVHEMVQRGVEKEKIFPLGIPIGSKFKCSRTKEEILAEYKLQNKPTFLLMGGSLGMGEIKSLFANLLNSKKDCQLIVVCGKNTKLKKQLEKLYLNSDTKIKALILGFTDNVPELMSISDIIITKPGGLTITESMLMKLPVLIVSPIPGQEEKNASYLLNNGIGIRPYNIDSLEQSIWECLDNPLRLKHIKEMSEFLAKPNSAKDTAKLIKDLSENSKSTTA